MEYLDLCQMRELGYASTYLFSVHVRDVFRISTWSLSSGLCFQARNSQDSLFFFWCWQLSNSVALQQAPRSELGWIAFRRKGQSILPFVRAIRSDQVRGLVCHNQSKGRILLCLHPSHSQEIPEVCFRGRSLQYQVLPFGLALLPRTFTKCVSSVAATGHQHTQLHWRLVDSHSIRADGGSALRFSSCPHESAGVKTERQEKCAFSGSENHLFGRGVGFAYDAGSYDTCSDRVDPHHSCEGERRPVTHYEAGSETAGSDGSCVQCEIYWPAVHETPKVVA